MTVLIYVTLIVIGIFIGVISYVKVKTWQQKRKKAREEIENAERIECEECDMDSLTKEWEVTIQTQMHFNDLIIKFRSIVLSVFIASLGFIYGFTKQLGLTNSDFILLMILAFVFWICSFLLDYFYYHKLLMGSVNHAKKFDENHFFIKKGLFGLSKRISYEIEPIAAKLLIWLFYLIPIVGVLLILLYKNFTIINN